MSEKCPPFNVLSELRAAAAVLARAGIARKRTSSVSEMFSEIVFEPLEAHE